MLYFTATQNNISVFPGFEDLIVLSSIDSAEAISLNLRRTTSEATPLFDTIGGEEGPEDVKSLSVKTAKQRQDMGESEQGHTRLRRLRRSARETRASSSKAQ